MGRCQGYVWQGDFCSLQQRGSHNSSARLVVDHRDLEVRDEEAESSVQTLLSLYPNFSGSTTSAATYLQVVGCLGALKSSADHRGADVSHSQYSHVSSSTHACILQRIHRACYTIFIASADPQWLAGPCISFPSQRSCLPGVMVGKGAGLCCYCCFRDLEWLLQMYTRNT